MTKLVSLRLVVPVGDELTTEALQAAIRALVGALPVGLAVEGDDQRIHWPALATYRFIERTAAAAVVRRKGKAARPADEVA
jgi:hypothetical protein